MALTVVTFASYRTSVHGWRKADYDAHDFVKALKGQPFNEYSWLKVRGQFRKFDNSNRHDVTGWFGELAGDFLRERGPKPPFTLVPIPGSCEHRSFKGTGATTRMAHAVAQHCGLPGVTARDILRFERPMVPSHSGGVRNWEAVYAQLCVTEEIHGERVVIIDDVIVTGGHIRAAAARIGEHGAKVLAVICGARAVTSSVTDPFGARMARLSEFGPACSRSSNCQGEDWVGDCSDQVVRL